MAAGTAYVVRKLPPASRVSFGPRPSGGNNAADELSCVALPDGQNTVPATGITPEIMTVLPGGADAGDTAMLGLT